jgi:hypothetical protein
MAASEPTQGNEAGGRRGVGGARLLGGTPLCSAAAQQSTWTSVGRQSAAPLSSRKWGCDLVMALFFSQLKLVNFCKERPGQRQTCDCSAGCHGTAYQQHTAPFHCPAPAPCTLANALSLLLKNAQRRGRAAACIEGSVSVMFLRAPALLFGSAVAAASALSIVNANSSALKEPATGIGECCVRVLQKLRPSMSSAQY